MRQLPSARVTELHRLRNRFGPGVSEEKTALLETCAGCSLTKPSVMLRYHDTLLFMAAHPESRSHLRQIESELQRIDEAAPAHYQTPDGAEALQDTGLAGGDIEGSFSIALTSWLLKRFPEQVGLAWHYGTAGGDLFDLVALAIPWVERDGRLNAEFDMQRWIRFFNGNDSTDHRDLEWVIDCVRTLIPDPDLRDHITNCIILKIQWKIPATGMTRTANRFPARRLFMQRSPLKRSFNEARLLGRTLPEPVPLSPAATRELIDTARGVLTVRRREADTVTYATPHDSTLYSLDRGIDIALFGLEPGRRLPVETYVGYIAARNRVPAAYGGAWVMDRRAEVGVHLFEALRGGESAYLFGSILRTYRHRFDIKRFRVDPYQFGDENPDAIRSGAFWFYYRFGFRSLDTSLRQLADDEWQLICADRKHRTAASVLRQFTKSPLVLDFDGAPPDAYYPDPTRLSIAITTAFRDRFGNDRTTAEDWARRRVSRILPVGRRSSWSDAEIRAFDRLCPLIALLPDLNTWPARDQRALVALMRAKGGPRETDYVSRMQRLPRLRTAFAQFEDSIDWNTLPARPRRRPA